MEQNIRPRKRDFFLYLLKVTTSLRRPPFFTRIISERFGYISLKLIFLEDLSVSPRHQMKLLLYEYLFTFFALLLAQLKCWKVVAVTLAATINKLITLP